MPAALLVPGLVFFGALVLVALAQTMGVTTKAQTEAQHSFWGALMDALTGKAIVKAITQQTRAAVSRWALSQLKPVARWFTALGLLVQATVAAQADFAEEAARAIAKLAGVDVKAIARTAVAPVKTAAKAAQHAATKATAHATTVARDVAGLRREVIPRLRTVERATTKTLPKELARLNTAVVDLEHEFAHPDLSFLKRWAKMLWVAGMAGLMVKWLARYLPWLFCSNVKQVGQRLCGMDSSLLDALFAGTLVLFGGFSIVQLAEEVLAIEDELVSLVAQGVTELRQFA